MTPDERKRAKDGHAWGVPKFDFLTSGKIELQIHENSYSKRTYRDSDVRLLDHRLGLAVIDMEQIPRDRKARAEEARRHRIEQEAAERQRRIEREAVEQQQRIEAEAAERLRREEKIQRKHQEMLKQELEQAVTKWQQAQQLRTFLSAIKESVPEAVRDSNFQDWLSWAERYVEEADPLANPLSIATPMRGGACSEKGRQSPSEERESALPVP